jgi:hypothetical protein
MHLTMAFVFGYLIAVIDFGVILEGLGLEPATKPKVISFDLDCIWSHQGGKRELTHQIFSSLEECELTHQGDKTSSSYFYEEHDFTKFVSAAFSGRTRPRGDATPSMSTAAMNPVASDSNNEANSIDDAKLGENAGATRKNPLKAVLSGAAVAAAVFTPTASMAQAGPAQAAAQMVDFSKDGISMFNNIRTPAALVAGSCLNLAFAVPTDEKDTRGIRTMKRANVLIGFASITSQLITVIFATNAINRLTEHAGTVETMATGLSELLKKDLFSQFWLGTYIHFMIGIAGFLAMVSFRFLYFMGKSYNMAIGTACAAIALRLMSAINRGVVVTEFGGGPGGSNFLYLVINYVWITIASAWKHRRIADLMSVILASAATFMFVKIAARRDTTNDEALMT